MKCQELETFLTDFLEDELDAKAADEMFEHIDACPACRDEFQAYQRQEEQLGVLFQNRMDKLHGMKNPLLDAPRDSIAPRGLAKMPRWARLAAAAAIVMATLVGGLKLYDNTRPFGQGDLAVVTEVRGRAMTVENGVFRLLETGDAIQAGERIKAPAGSGITLEFHDGNLLEAKEGTQFSLIDRPDRLEVAMRRGKIWAHLATPPKKPFVVTTAHMTVTATGTVFIVEEGLDRSVVAVARGQVRAEAGGAQTTVGAFESFSSQAGAVDFQKTASPTWTNLQNQYVTDASDPLKPPPLYTPPSSAVSAAARIACIEYVPENTLYLLHIRDLREAIDKLEIENLADIQKNTVMRKWWDTIGAPNTFAETISDLRVLEALDLVRAIDGELVLSINAKGVVTLLADCEVDAEELKRRIDALVGEKVADWSREVLKERLFVEQGCLIFSNDREQALTANARVRHETPSKFTQGDFYQKILADVQDPSLILAADLGGQIALWSESMARGDRQAQRVDSVTEFLGLKSLDYLLVSPSFAGGGSQQAARVAFTGEGRQGAMDWLAEPAPMRGLDFFSPNIPFFAAAHVRNPERMCIDYLLLAQDRQDQESFDKMLAFIANNEPFFQSFGGEIAVGIDFPLLPVPNLKIAIEITDQDAFRAGLEQLTASVQDSLRTAGRESVLDTSTYKHYTIHSLVIDVAERAPIRIFPSWTYVNDFFVAGPSPEFVQNSIDVYLANDTIANDAQRLLPLLPDSTEMHYSLLIYQDFASAIPSLLGGALGGDVFPTGLLGLLSGKRLLGAPGIAYAYARPTCIDLYINGREESFQTALRSLMPALVAWVAPPVMTGRLVGRVNEATNGLNLLRQAVAQFETDNGRLPDSMEELLNPPTGTAMLTEIPHDPFAPGAPLRFAEGPKQGQVTFYSVGPDGSDDGGFIVYELNELRLKKAGDIVVRIPAE